MSPSLSIVSRLGTADAAGAAVDARPRRLLVVSSQSDDGLKLSRLLARATGGHVDAVLEPRPRQALRRLCRAAFDAAIVEAELLSGAGADALGRFAELAPDVPMLVLARADDAGIAERAIRLGAQDVLTRTELTGSRLALAIACGRERTRRLAELHEASLTDPLTGLCNRRGFQLLAESHVRLLRRTRRQSLLLFADVDDLKGINDRRGHAAGDRALLACARALKASLRDSDIVARHGGDEFAALALDVSEGAALVLLPRIADQLDRVSRAMRLPMPVTLSVGTASFARGRLSLDEILDLADRAMYGDKRCHARADVADEHAESSNAPAGSPDTVAAGPDAPDAA